MAFIILLLILSFLSLVILYIFSRERPRNFPPGPPRLPFWGSYWFLLKENYLHPHLALANLRKYYKTDILGFYLGSAPTIVTFSNELCKEVLTREEFIGRVDTIVVRERGRGELRGIFFVDGLFWKEQRRFSLRQMRNRGFGRRFEQLENLVKDEINGLIDLLHSEPTSDTADICRAKGVVSMPDVLYGPLLNIIFSLLASTSFDNRQLREVARAGLRFQQSGDATGRALVSTPWLRYIAPDYFGYTAAVESNDYMLEFLQSIIKEHLETFSDDYHRDYIDVFISEMKNDVATFDYKQLLLTVLDYMFPAAIAAGHTLDFYFAYIVNYPQVQIKIQNEIDKVVGRSRLPNLDDRQSLPYTEASIKEALRILPLNPLGLPRRCVVDTTLAGYFIPKDTVILPSIWTAHKDEKIWNNPDDFLPERFLDENGNLLRKDYILGFGAGKRVCVGETFAKQNMFLIISGLLQNFTFSSSNGKPIDVINLVPGVNMALKEHWIKATPR